MPDPRQKLYKALSSKYDLGTYEEFNSKMDNSESRKKLYDFVSNDFDLGTFNEFETKVAPKKKKESSTSTSGGQKLVSETQNGSSDSQQYENKPILDEKGKEVYYTDKSTGQLKPAIEKVPKGTASETEYRQIQLQDLKKRAEKNFTPSVNLKKYQDAVNPTEEEIASLSQEIDDKINEKGFLNGLTTGLKKFWNNVLVPGAPMELTPYSKERKQAETELTKKYKGDTSKITEEEVNQLTKDIVLDQKVEALKIDKNNNFLSNISDADKKALELERISQYKTLSDKDKYYATESSLMGQKMDKLAKDYNVVKAYFKKSIEESNELPTEFIEKATELEQEIQNTISQAEDLEQKINNNTSEISSAEEEIDFLKRNYDIKEKFIQNIKLGAGDFYVNISKNLPLLISEIDNTIFEPLRPGSEEGIMSEQERNQLLNEVADWQEAKQITKSKVYKDVEFDNLTTSNFGEFFFQELGTQIPIFAQIALPGGVASIGVTSASDKYSQMALEGNDYSSLQMLTASIGFGTAESVLGALPTKGILNRSVTAMERTGQRTLLRESGKKYLTRNLKNIVSEASLESVSEGLTQVTQNFIDKTILNKKEVGLFDNVGHASFSGGMLGGAIPVMPTIAGLMLKPFSNEKQNTAVRNNMELIFSLQNQLNDSSISEETRNVINEKIAVLENQNKETLTSIAEKTQNQSEEVTNAIIDVNKKQEILKIKASEINSDPNLDEKVKQELVKDLENQFNLLEDKRLKLVSNNVSVLEALPDSEVNKLKEQASKELVSQAEAEGKKEGSFNDEQITKKAIEIYNRNKQNAVQQEATITETKQEAQPQAEEQKTEQEVLNETTPTNNIASDGEVRPGTNEVATTEQTDNASGNESLQSTNDSRNVTTKEITVPGFANNDSNYDVDFDENGGITEIRSKKDGRKIEKFSTYEVLNKKTGKVEERVRKNANYAKIEAAALGVDTNNQSKVKRDAELNNAIENFAPTNEYEAAMESLARGQKVSSESIQQEFGNKDNKWATNPFSKEALPSIETLSEKIAEKYPHLDQQLIRDALIGVIGNFNNVEEVKEDIFNTFTEQQNALAKQEARAILGSLSEQELAMYEAVQAEDSFISELSNEELQEYQNSLIEEYEQGKRATTEQQAREATNSMANESIASNEKTQRESAEKEITPEEKSKIDQLADVLERANKRLKDFGDETLGINLPIVVARGAIKAMQVAVQTAKTAQEIIDAGLEYVRNSEWYQNLSKKEQTDIDTNFVDYINKPFQGTESKKSRPKIEEEIQDRLDNGETKEDILKSIEDKREKMIAEDYITRKEKVTSDKAKKVVEDSFNKADEALQDKKTTTEKIDKAFRNFIARFFDRQFVPKFILNKAGGRLVRNYLIATKGATGYAKQMYDNAYEKIYKGLSSSDIKLLDKIIQLRRFIAIDENRAKNDMPDVVHPDFINKDIAKQYLIDLEIELGTKKFNDLVKRADNYFAEFRNLLAEMEKSGLISKESLDQFFEIDYQPRKFLEFLQKNETDFQLETSDNSNLSKDQILKLEDGLNSSLVYDSQYLLSTSMNIRAKAIAVNKANTKLVEFMEKQAKVVDDLRNKKDKTKKEKDTIKYFDELTKRVKINPIIGVTDTGKPKYKYALPKGFKNAYYYVNGVKHQIMMEETFHEQYFDSLKGVFKNNEIKEKLVLATGVGLVKSLATGNNPTFFITNTPRDFLFISTFSEEYGNNVFVNMAKLAKDAYLGVRDIRKEKDTFKNFIKYGGMMDFLKDQGKFKGTKGINKLFDKIDNKTKEKSSKIFDVITLNKLQTYSEVGFRMAVFNRSIKNQLKELGFKNISEVTDQATIDDIYTNAVASARSTMDFNQGGTVTKDLDAVIPYFNAATQGTRVMLDNFRERPLETSLRVAQTSMLLSSAAIGTSIAMFSAFGDEDDERTATEKYLYAKKGVSKYDQTNYFIIFTGRKTDSGQYEYIRVAKPQQLTPFFSFADGFAMAYVKKAVGDNTSSNAVDNVMFALEKNISPVDFSITGNLSRTPLAKAALGYSTGYDFYREEDLSYMRGKVPVAAEGFESLAVEDFYKKIGEEYGVSPVRFKAGVESFITTPSTSPYVGFLYGGLDALASDKDGKEVLKKLGKDIQKSTLNRLRKETTDFNRRLSNNEVLKEKIEKQEIENLKNKTLFKQYANSLINKEMTPAQVQDEIVKLSQESPYEAKRLTKMIQDKIKNKNVSPYVFEMKYARSAEAKALMLIELFGDGIKNYKILSSEEKKLINEMLEMKAINEETMYEYNRLLKE